MSDRQLGQTRHLISPGQLPLYVRFGELVALTGASGMGKSTLLKAIAGVVGPGKWQVRLEGRALSRDARKFIGFVQQR